LGRDRLERVAAVAFGDHVVAQALEVLRVGHRLDAGGVDRLHGFDQAEDAVELGRVACASASLISMRASGRCAGRRPGERHGMT
jgi:hypothetical protein